MNSELSEFDRMACGGPTKFHVFVSAVGFYGEELVCNVDAVAHIAELFSVELTRAEAEHIYSLCREVFESDFDSEEAFQAAVLSYASHF